MSQIPLCHSLNEVPHKYNRAPRPRSNPARTGFARVTGENRILLDVVQ